MPERLPQTEYDERRDRAHRLTTKAYVSFKGRLWKVPQAFAGERLAIRPSHTDGCYGVFFGAHQIADIDLTHHKSVGDVSEHMSVILRAEHQARQ